MTNLTPASCDLFNLPCYQFAQLKTYAPETIPQIKVDYKAAWETWRAIIQRVAALLGEPFAAVDVEYTPRLRVAVKAALAEVGCPCIIVTHDPADVAALADDVAVLENGRIVEHGSAAEIMASPESSFGKLLFVRD